MGMTITWLGHSCFRVECGDYAVVLDPYEPGSVPGCGDVRETADQVCAATNTTTTTTGAASPSPAGGRGPSR